MSGIRATSVPTLEPVSVGEAQDYLKIPRTQDVAIVSGLIVAARQYCEAATGRSLASKDYEMTLDSFPYYTDTVVSQQAFPPSFYSLPRASTTLWNYSQLIKLWYPPVTLVKKITYIGTDGEPHDLFPGQDFVVDYLAEPCRIFTIPGGFWPPCGFTPNAVTIFYTAGLNPNPTHVDTIAADASIASPPVSLPTPPDQQAQYVLWTGVPQTIRTAILMLTSHWYFNREPVAAGSVSEVPQSVDALLSTQTNYDLNPTRG